MLFCSDFLHYAHSNLTDHKFFARNKAQDFGHVIVQIIDTFDTKLTKLSIFLG